MIAGWAVPTILQHGTDAQRERFVRPSLLGELVWCQLFSEPGCRLRPRLAADDSADPGRTAAGGSTGQKVWTSVAERADWGICLARTDQDAPQHKGITYFLVDMKSRRASTSARCARSPGRRCSTRCSSTTCSCPTTAWSPSPATAGGSPAPRSPTSGSRWRARRLGKSVERAVELAAAGPRSGRDGQGRARRRAGDRVRPARCARRRCARSVATDRARSRAWPSCSASAAVSRPRRSSSSCRATRSPRRPDRPRRRRRGRRRLGDAQHPLPVHRRRYDADPAQRRGERILGLPRWLPSCARATSATARRARTRHMFQCQWR